MINLQKQFGTVVNINPKRSGKLLGVYGGYATVLLKDGSARSLPSLVLWFHNL